MYENDKGQYIEVEGQRYYLLPDDYHKWRWRILTIWAVGLSAAIMFAFAQLREQRESSCQRTYEGVREVFTPFFDPPLTPMQIEKLSAKQKAAYREQRDDYALFNKTIDELKEGCGGQILST